MQRLNWLIGLAAALALSGCGGGGTSARGHHKPPPDEKPGEGQYAGRLDASDIQRVITQHKAGFNNCLNKGGASYLSGDVIVELAVAETGRVAYAGVARSDLGSWVIEDCLVETAGFLAFPRPQGGGARFAYTFPGPTIGRRLVHPMDASWGYRTLRRARKPINDCRRRYDYDGPFHITAYVGAQGQVLDAGFDAKLRPRREFAACVVGVVRGLTFPPGAAGTAKYRALIENLDDDA